MSEVVFTPTARRIVRGQVWFVSEETAITAVKVDKSHVQAGTRPYVMMTNDDLLNNRSVIQGYPITRSVGSITNHSFTDVILRDHENRLVRVITGQLTSIDADHVGRYLYTMPREVMEVLGKVTLYNLGLADAAISSEVEAMCQTDRKQRAIAQRVTVCTEQVQVESPSEQNRRQKIDKVLGHAITFPTFAHGRYYTGTVASHDLMCLWQSSIFTVEEICDLYQVDQPKLFQLVRMSANRLGMPAN